MKYARLEVKTRSGIKTRYFSYNDEWLFGKHLYRYYRGKDYLWDALSETSADYLKKIGKIEFKHIAN